MKLKDQLRPAILSVLILSLLTGCIFPLLLFGIARPLFPRQAEGSLVWRGQTVIGSELIGQQFTRPEYFQPRPSAAGNGYDGASSGGTNLGPNNPRLTKGAADFAGILQLAEEYRKRNGLLPDTEVPIDAVTRSGSGLDPHISPANAALQLSRVAHARGLGEEAVRRLVANYTDGRQFWFLGNPRVRVLELNIALDRMSTPAVERGSR
jgi:K+-transporting ATPase ATPase C chain